MVMKAGRKGFTLVESLLAVSVLATAVFAITMPFAAAAQNELEDARRTIAASLANELAEEILSKPFYDPQGQVGLGPDFGETYRSQFDNIDDYDGFIESAGNVSDVFGNVLDDSAAVNLSRHAKVEYVYLSGQDSGESPTFVRITVTVKYVGDTILEVSRLKYAYP
ncbi:MAG: type IV pilus modification PilV family protein [Planctomycetota bacterium]|jgi:prepilin-type N-terminal cleavage/methylation domain-containing protein